jgi:Fe-S oxidoreductase
MATLKAEFYAHYYRNRLRPRSAYAMGLIYWWARAAARAPWLANFLSQAPGLSSVAKVAAGVSQKRRLPKFAQQTFRNWYGEQRPRKTGAAPRVLLFPDTFNNNFFPETAKAGLEVLEALGFDVIVPPRNLCCGRPLYDFGMLGLAKRQLRQILQTLRPLIREGLPMVVLEPSCLAVFRDEMGGLFPHDIDARRLSERTYLLSEFIEKFAKDRPLPHIGREALVHGHCHQKALIGMSADTAVLDKMGIKTDMPETGCCGMAGSFGFEATHYDVSVAVGERVLLPAVREADGEKLIIADGFSCREQIAQTTNRRALHLADVLAQALRDEHAAQQRPEAARAMAHAGRR